MTRQTATSTSSYPFTSVFDMEYIYTAGQNNGRIVQSVEHVTGETVNYTYDSLNHLSKAETGATGPQWGQAYGFDGFGNLTSQHVTKGSGTESTQAYDLNNHAVGGNYDANGLLMGYNFSYDVENRLVSQSLDYFATSWGYDPTGKRIMKRVGTDFNYTYPNYEYYFYDITGRRIVTYSCPYGAACTASPTVYFRGKLVMSKGIAVVTDRLGSVRANSNNERFAYLPYGEEEAAPATADGREKFGTYVRDSTASGQDYADQRYYNPWYGRFYTPDPGGIRTADPRNPGSWNRYVYVQGDPVNFHDRTGRVLDDPNLEAPTDWPGWSDGGGGPCDFVDSLDPASVFTYCDIPVGPIAGPSGGSGGPDCNAITAAVGFAGLTYANASEIWNDGGLSTYSTDSTAATIAALAGVTWQGESSFGLKPNNNPNYDDNGNLSSVDYGPFQINQAFHPNSNSAVWGTNGAGQTFNGNPDANITFGIQILEGLYARYDNNAAGRYVGSLGNWKNTTKNHQAGTPINPSAQKREATWNSWSGRLTTLFSTTDCFSHR